MQQESSVEDGSDRDTLTRGATFELAIGSSRFSIQKGTVERLLCIVIFLCTLDHRRIMFSA